VARPKQIKMQMQVGALAAIPQLENRTDEQLQSESKHRVAAKAILGARAAERYDVDAARKYFNEALAGSHPQERPALRQMMKASMALAERRPDDLKQAMEKLGQEAPSGRQLFMLRMMGLLIPPASAGIIARVRGIVLLVLLVIVLLALGLGIVKLIALPFGGVSTGPAPVVARQLALRAQLGEDRHHHAADVVALLGVRQSGLEQLQRLLVVAGVPGVEGGLQLVAGAAEAGARPEALRDEVAGHALQQLERLVGLTAAEQQARQVAAGGRVIRVGLQRAP
jgi:hypothetical protein